MPSLLTRLLASIAALAILGSSTILPAFAAGLSLTPPKFEFDADPGQVIQDKILITNGDIQPLHLSSSIQDFVAGGETGQPSFVDSSAANASTSISRWITVPHGDAITIQPGEKKEIPFTITVPKDAEPGGKYGAIFFTPPATTGQIGVASRIGSLLVVRVKGNIVESGTLDTFGAYAADIQGEDLPKSSSSFFYQHLPASFAIRYHNTGNIQLKPQGKIEITNTFGMQVKSIGVLTTVNDQGIEISKDIVDYIPVNDSHGNVLAQSYRTFRAEWAGTPFWYRNEDGTKDIHYKGLPLGLYTATLTLTGANGTPITQSTHIFVFPILEVGGGLIVIVALFFGIRGYSRHQRRRIEAEIQRRMSSTHHEHHPK